MVSSSQDFGVEQFFRADEFRADVPSPLFITYFTNTVLLSVLCVWSFRWTGKRNKKIC
jgi:hypothetical protein